MKRLLQRRKRSFAPLGDGDREPPPSASASIAPKPPRLTLGLLELPSTRLVIPHLRRRDHSADNLRHNSATADSLAVISASDSITSPDNFLCFTCQRIANHVRRDTLQSLRQHMFDTTTPYHVLCNLDGNKAILTQNAMEGCQLCSLRLKHSEENVYETLGELSNELTDVIFSDPLEFHSINHAISDRKYRYVQAWCTKAGDFVSSVPEDSPGAKAIKRRPPLKSHSSERAFAQALEWMDECDAEHGTACTRKSFRTVLPTRVIDVGSSTKEPSLFCPPQGYVGQFLVLSYCWGLKPQTTLTTDLITSRETLSQGIIFPMDSLPATVRDAILITRRLGFQFLWVDALCIIQDSHNADDWTRESASMNEIYGNSSITLTAAAASNVWEGILTPTHDIASRDCSIPLSLMAGVTETITSEASIDMATVTFYPYDIDTKQPLSTRAWALQEHAMSQRVLSFQKEQLVWECKKGKFYMNGPVNARPSVRTGKTWEDWVVEFTDRKLTFPDDRLIAISGYAKSISTKQHNYDQSNRYFAGLWEEHLVDHMLWISKVRPPPPRPSFYRAPTWSWASIDGPVEYVAPERKGSKSCTIQLLFASLSLNPLNPFGNLAKSPPNYLHLRGFWKQAPGIEIPSKNAQLPMHREFRNSSARNWWIEFDIIDVQERMKKTMKNTPSGFDISMPQNILYCLRLTELTALILVPVGKHGDIPVFERIGIVRHWHREEWKWFDDVKERTELILF